MQLTTGLLEEPQQAEHKEQQGYRTNSMVIKNVPKQAEYNYFFYN